MAKSKSRRSSPAVASASPFEEARDELFQQIMTCGVIGADAAHQHEWFDETLKYFFNVWLKQKGHGFIGTHSATDTYGDYKPYWDMIGGTFNGHPWGSGETVTVKVPVSLCARSRLTEDWMPAKASVSPGKRIRAEAVSSIERFMR